MNRKNTALHGSAPDKSAIALIMVDVINHFDFSSGPHLLAESLKIADSLARLKKAARARGIPCIYANDNFGRWRSDLSAVVTRCLERGGDVARFIRQVEPAPDDYFVLKPKHSGFYASALELLLDHLQTSELILTGLTTDMCVFFTAYDAYMRDFKVHVPPDCTASASAKSKADALEMMRKVLKADIRESRELITTPAFCNDLTAS